MTCVSGHASLDDAKSYFAQSLKMHLKKSGYKGYQVAAAIGVASQTLSNWVAGRSFPDANNQIKLCKVLGVSIQELYPPQDWKALNGSIDFDGLAMKEPMELDCLEVKLVRFFRGMDANGRRNLLQIASDMAASRHYLNETSTDSLDEEGDS